MTVFLFLTNRREQVDKVIKFSNESALGELLSENRFAVEIQKNFNIDVKMVTEPVDSFDNSVEVAVIKSQFVNIQPLVPYDDTDGSLSDNEDIVTGCLTTEERHRLIQSSSNSSSSSALSLDSSNSSSSGSSNCSPSPVKVNLLTHITQNVTVGELDSDGIVVNRRPRELKRV
ncbi:unnamed protein product [Diabrotica balteata]|uniref:Uncharacterized protein n=1 Tax=Diabrotica balteata TaxID=107213 RepID=A0A9N9T3F5_DIABA|nr:unnamed protein product [Diabrotica balteata]